MTKRLIVAPAILCILATCTAETERISIRMDEDLRTSFASSVVDNSSDGNALRALEPMVEECGFRANVFRIENGHRMNVQLSNVGEENIESYLACVPTTTGRQFELRPSYEDGWFFRYFEFSGSITTARCNPRNEPGTKRYSATEARELNYSFPRRIDVLMPGQIASLDVQSHIAGGRYVGRSEGVNARIEWTSPHPGFAEVRRSAYCQSLPQPRREAERDTLRVKITSRQTKFDLDTLLAVLGIVISSGIVLEISRRLSRRRVDRKPS